MKLLAYLVIIGCLILTSCTKSPSNEEKLTVLKGATLYDGTGKSFANSVLIIRDGKIEAVGGEELEIPENAEIIDLDGKYITPGLVDAHVHFSQTGFFDGRPDALDIRDTIPFDTVQARQRNFPDRYFETYLRSGVTAVYDVGGFEWTIDLAKSAEADLNAPHVAAAGPLLTPFPQDRLDLFNVLPDRQMIALTSPELGREVVKKHTQLGSTGIKIWSLNLMDSVFMTSLRAVAEEVPVQGNQLIVHATTLDQAKEGLRLGAKVLVHSVDDQVIDEEFIQLAKESGVIVFPTLVVIPGYSIAYKSLLEGFPINDPNQVIDPETRKLLDASRSFIKFYKGVEELSKLVQSLEEENLTLKETINTNLKLLFDAGVQIALSTDAGNPGTLHGLSIYDELEAMQKAGIPASALILIATQNGAKAMRRFEDFGSLEVGKMADLIILEKDPSLDASNFRSVSHVMRGGMLRPVNVPFEK